jgi:NADPH:quinone reductase
MHAVRFHRKGPPDVLQYDEVERPAASAGCVVARTLAIGLNFADVMRRKGEKYPVPTPLPYTAGGEAVAIVEEVGPGVDRSLIGTRALVFPGLGCYAEYVSVPEGRVYPLPDSLDDAQAVALFVQGLSAAFMLRDFGRIAPGETVLVHGAAGGVGSLAVQLAKIYGAGTVIGCASTPEKRALAERLGADFTVDYTQEGWADLVREQTGGRGVDIVLEMIGGQVARDSFGLLAPMGRSIIYGQMDDDDIWKIESLALLAGNYTVSGFWLRLMLDNRENVISYLQDFGNLIKQGRLHIEVGGRYRLSEAAKAHAAVENRETSGKIMLIPDGLYGE